MSERVFRLLLIDSDLVFRLGVRAWLEGSADLQIEAEADTSEAALALLGSRSFDLVLLDLGLDRLDLCQRLQTQYPSLPILILSAARNSESIEAALKLGVQGHWIKGTNPDELVIAIRRVGSGQTYFSDRPSASSAIEAKLSPLAMLRQNIRRSSLRQIDANLADVRSQLAGNSSGFDRAILQGQQRELKVARWLVNRVLLRGKDIPVDLSVPLQLTSLLDPALPPTQTTLPLRSYLFDSIASKLEHDLQNLTSIPLEIDILKAAKKRELLKLIVQDLERILSDLIAAEITPIQLQSRLPQVMRDLWQIVVTNFFGRYFALSVNESTQISEHDIVPVILKETAIVQAEVLDKIPLVTELFAHILFRSPLEIDNTSYAVGTSEAMLRSKALLENLIIEVANAVIQPLLNNFANVELIKQKFYNYNLITTREIERFRNDLSWKYRRSRYFDEPKAIFESQFPLLVLNELGITKIDVYAPRTQELKQLSGIRFIVTLVLELQDALAPRLRSTVAFLGSGFVYVLTEIIGRGLGLIARGILQGIGSAWQDHRFRKFVDRAK